MRSFCRIAITTLLSAGFLSTSLFAENWPQWRGPHGSGMSGESKLPTTWSRDANVKWSVPLPEPGNSSPVVWGDKVFLTQPEKDANKRKLICFSLLNGQALWQKDVTYSEEEATHRTNHYCSPSPVTDGERVIVWFGSAGLVCYDMDGNEQWKRELGTVEHMWGYGTSPIIYGDICILNFGPGNHEQLIGIDKATGEDRWKVEPIGLKKELALSGNENDGNAKSKGDEPLSEMLRGSWGTPVLVNTGSRDELIVGHPRRVSGYEPTTGKLLWTCGGYAPLVYISPMVHDKTVIALGGYFGASLAVPAGGKGDVSESRLWHKNRDGTWLGSGVTYNGHAYVYDMGGIATCLNVETGEQAWKKRMNGSGGKSSTWGSMTMTADGTAYQLMQNGDTFVFKASPDGYQQISRNDLGEESNSTIVISNGHILIRTFETLWCIHDGEAT